MVRRRFRPRPNPNLESDGLMTADSDGTDAAPEARLFTALARSRVTTVGPTPGWAAVHREPKRKAEGLLWVDLTHQPASIRTAGIVVQTRRSGRSARTAGWGGFRAFPIYRARDAHALEAVVTPDAAPISTLSLVGRPTAGYVRPTDRPQR